MPPWVLTITTWATWLFEKGLAAFTTAWNTSRKATEIAMVGFVAFIVLIYFGYVKEPNMTPELSRQIGQLSLQVDTLRKEMASKNDISFIEDQIAFIEGQLTPKAKGASRVTTGSIARKARTKESE